MWQYVNKQEKEGPNSSNPVSESCEHHPYYTLIIYQELILWSFNNLKKTILL